MNFIKHKILKEPAAICPDFFEPNLPTWVQRDTGSIIDKRFWIAAGAAEYALYENSHPSAFKVIYWVYERDVIALLRTDNKKTILLNNKFTTEKEKEDFFIDLEIKVNKNSKNIRMNISFNVPLSVINKMLTSTGMADKDFRIVFPNLNFRSESTTGHLIEIQLHHTTDISIIEKVKSNLKIINDYFSEKDFTVIKSRMKV